jgi:glucan-binding YG repeat protein
MALDDGKLRYFRSDGSLLTGWQILDDERYYFDTDGYASTGWTEIGGQKFLFSTYGILLTGWQTENLEIYYLDDDGMVRTGQQVIDGRPFWFSTAGELLTGWQSDENGPRYRDLSSQPVTGLQMIDGKTWLFDEQGQLLTGWQRVGEHQYYFDPVTAAGQSAGLFTIDGEARLFNNDGSLHQQAGLFFAGDQVFLSDDDGRPQVSAQTLTGINPQGESIDIILQFADGGQLLTNTDAGFSLAKASQNLMISDDPAQGQGQLNLQNPASESDLPLIWLSLDPTVAVVSDDGSVQAVGNGQTLAIAQSAAGHYTACIITVFPDLNNYLPTEIHLTPEQSADLPLSGLPAVPGNLVLFTSTAPAVAEVDETGRITALQPGQSDIIVTYHDQSVIIGSVTVSQPLLGLAVNRSNLLLPVGAQAESFAERINSGSLEMISFTSSLPNVASVSADGTIRGLSHGTAVITAAAGDFSASCTVTVSGTYPTLRRGNSGEQVRDLQQRLTELGYIVGPVDGSFGPLTEFGVLCFQKNLGLILTGTADHALRVALQGRHSTGFCGFAG